MNNFRRRVIITENLKKQSLDAISKLPDSTNVDDVMCRLYVIDKVRKVDDAVNRGGAIVVEDLKREIRTW